MKGLLAALQFLTTISLGRNVKISEKDLAKAPVYFPLIGVFLGLILSGVFYLFSVINFNSTLSILIIIILQILLTGGLHLDGLADTFDAIFSRKSKNEMLKIMRDPHIGTMGTLSLIVVILLKVFILFSLNKNDVIISLILMNFFSRYSFLPVMFIFPYARNEGKAKVFIDNMNSKKLIIGSLFCISILSCFVNLILIITFIITIIFSILLAKYFSNKVLGITGDILGAISELTEVFVVLNILVFSRLQYL